MLKLKALQGKNSQVTNQTITKHFVFFFFYYFLHTLVTLDILPFGQAVTWLPLLPCLWLLPPRRPRRAGTQARAPSTCFP